MIYRDLNALLNKVRETPRYVYNLKFLNRRIEFIQNTISKFHSKHSIFEKIKVMYAIKANDNKTVLEIINKGTFGFDAVSMGEIKKALAVGSIGNDVIFSGIGKTKKELLFAIRNNIKQINIESAEELEEVIQIARRLKQVVNIGIRINPLTEHINTHSHITTGDASSKFGVHYNEVLPLLEMIKNEKFINLNGFSIHIGSQILNIMDFQDGFRKLIEVTNDAINMGFSITTVDFGGGLGIDYLNQDTQFEENLFLQYIALIYDSLSYIKSKTKITPIIEPGRFIIGNSCLLLTKVIRVKKTGATDFAIIDAGMTEILRIMLYNATHKIIAINNNNQEIGRYNIVGPICESTDFLAENIVLPKLQKDSLLAIMSAGAYCESMTLNYNSRPKCLSLYIAG